MTDQESTALARRKDESDANGAPTNRRDAAGQALVQQTPADPVVLGKVLAESGYFSDARSAAQAAVKVMAGQELGLGPIAAMSGVHIIEGKPSIGANLMAALVKSSPKYDYRITEHTEQVCKLEFFELGKPVGISAFTMEDAKRAEVATKKNWKQHPRNMLFARALSNGVRFYCPDLTSGAPTYVPEELGAEVNPETGDVLELPEGSARASDPTPVQTQAAPRQKTTQAITAHQRRQFFTWIKGTSTASPQYNADPPLEDEETIKAFLSWIADTEHTDRIPRNKFDEIRDAIPDWQAIIDELVGIANSPNDPDNERAQKIVARFLPPESLFGAEGSSDGGS